MTGSRRELHTVATVVALKNNARVDVAVSTAAAQSAALSNGVYDVWSTVDVFLKVNATANDVTTGNGYLLRANTTLAFYVSEGDRIGAVAGSAGTLSYHRTSWYAE